MRNERWSRTSQDFKEEGKSGSGLHTACTILYPLTAIPNWEFQFDFLFSGLSYFYGTGSAPSPRHSYDIRYTICLAFGWKALGCGTDKLNLTFIIPTNRP
jgi:hypothetical protein